MDIRSQTCAILLGFLTAVVPNAAFSTISDTYPEGFTPVMIPFQACEGVQLVTPSPGGTRLFRPLTEKQIQAYREQLKGLPFEFSEPTGLFLKASFSDPALRLARSEFARLLVAEEIQSLERQSRLTQGLRARCLAPVSPKDQWPPQFPSSCIPDASKTENQHLLVDHLRQIPKALSVFRIYYALASADTPAADRRLWDFDQQLNRELNQASLVALPERREALNTLEVDVAQKIFVKEWLTMLKELKGEQESLLANLSEAPEWTRAPVEQRLRNLNQALAKSDQPLNAIFHALTLADPDWQRMTEQRWHKAKFKFLRVALSSLNQIRVIGLMAKANAEIGDLDQAYAKMEDYQRTELQHYTALKNKSSALSDDELLGHSGPVEAVLAKRPDLCAVATLMFYKNADANLRRSTGIFGASLGISVITPTPVVVVGALAYGLYQILEEDRAFGRAWRLYMSANYDVDAIASDEDLIAAMDGKVFAVRGLVLNASGLAALKALRFPSVGGFSQQVLKYFAPLFKKP